MLEQQRGAEEAEIGAASEHQGKEWQPQRESLLTRGEQHCDAVGRPQPRDASQLPRGGEEAEVRRCDEKQQRRELGRRQSYDGM